MHITSASKAGDELEEEGVIFLTKFQDKLVSKPIKGLQMENNFLGEISDFITPVHLRRGFKLLFNRYAISEKDSINKLQDFKDHYSTLSQDLGFKIDIPELPMILKSDDLMEKKQYDSALEILNYTEEIYPGRFNAIWRLAGIYREQGQKEKAIEYYNMVLLAYPGMPQALKFIEELSK